MQSNSLHDHLSDTVTSYLLPALDSTFVCVTENYTNPSKTKYNNLSNLYAY